MYDTLFHFAALKRSGIDGVAALAGKRVGVGPRAGTPGTYFPLMFKELGLDITIANGQAADMASQLADGLIDCSPSAPAVPFPAYSELEATNEVVFFSFTADEIAKLKTAMPELSQTQVPAGTYRGVTSDQPTLGVFNFAICHKSLPDDLAHAIVEAVHASHDELVRGHAAAKEICPRTWPRTASCRSIPVPRATTARRASPSPISLSAPEVAAGPGDTSQSEVDAEGGTRRLQGWQGRLVALLAVSFTVFHLIVLNLYPIDPWLFRAIHVAGGAVLILALYPAWAGTWGGCRGRTGA